jgi:hypothetical protein
VSGHRDTSLLPAAAFLLAGPTLWAAHLFLVYGPQSALCAVGRTGDAGESFVTVLVLLVTALFAVPLVFLLAAPGTAARLLRFETEAADRRFSIAVMRWLSALSLVGVLLAGAAVLLVDPCAQLR